MQWLVCREICLPGKAFLGLNLKVAPTAPSATNPLIDAALHAEPLPLPSSVKVHVSATRSLLTVDVKTGHGRQHLNTILSTTTRFVTQPSRRSSPPARGEALTERAETSDTLPKQIKGVLKLSGGRSYTFDVPVGALVAQTASSGEPGLFFAIVLAFAGGIILNLMPCVFPVLFLKALSLVNSANESTSRQQRHGMAYTAGILFSFWVIVAVLLTLRLVGKQAGWGFQLQSPGFVVPMTFLLFFMDSRWPGCSILA